MELKLEEQWAEALTLLFVVVGFVFSVLLQTAVLSYLTIAVAGILAGRLFYIKRYQEPIFPFLLIIVGFLLGYLVGGFWVQRMWALALFLLLFWLSYYLHLKGIFVIFKSERFIK